MGKALLNTTGWDAPLKFRVSGSAQQGNGWRPLVKATAASQSCVRQTWVSFPQGPGPVPQLQPSYSGVRHSTMAQWHQWVFLSLYFWAMLSGNHSESLCNKPILMLHSVNHKNQQTRRFFLVLTLWPVTVLPLPSQMTLPRLDHQELNEQLNFLQKANFINKCMMDYVVPKHIINTDDWTWLFLKYLTMPCKASAMWTWSFREGREDSNVILS